MTSAYKYSLLALFLSLFRLLGTPNEPSVAWSEHTQDWHEYPQWKPLSLSTAVPNLDEAGLDLLSVSP